NIQSYEAANQYLEGGYLAEHNERFARPAASGVDYHRKTPSQKILDDVFRLETERVISNDGVVRYQNRLLQVKNQGRRTAPPQSKVVVCEWEDGRLDVRYRGQSLNWEEIPELPKPKVQKTRTIITVRPPSRPGADHPWRKPFLNPRSDSGAGISTRLDGDSACASPQTLRPRLHCSSPPRTPPR